MISIDQIISGNLTMLKEQEASLQKSLDFVRKAIQLFQSHGSVKTGRKRRSKRGFKLAPKAAATSPAPKKTQKAAAKRTYTKKSGKHIDRIIDVLKEKNTPLSSGELIQLLFSRQSAVPDIKRYGTLIYPVLTKAYKSGTLKVKNKKIDIG